MPYYSRPPLKSPVWTWEVPVYFFVGGLAGMAAVLGALGLALGADNALVRSAHSVAAAGALVSPLLLISDLGRPARFLNMLRVFKHRSPMSIGAWTLAIFGPAAVGAALLDVAGGPATVVQAARILANVVAAATGLLLATYTGVLLGVTVIPVWARNAAILPAHFAASSLGAAASTLELLGHRDLSLHALALAAALVETVIAVRLHLAGAGATGVAIRLGEIGSGFAPLVLRTIFGGVSEARTTAAVLAVAGALLTRLGWLEAGKRLDGLKA
jgi:formate-dependent nitrite reductase membrane component NrfD